MKTLRLGAALMIVLSMVACADRPAEQRPGDQQVANPERNADGPDATAAPGTDEASAPGPRAAAAQLRSDQIRTRHLLNNTVTSGKLAIKAVTVTVAAAGTAGSSAADPDLAGGMLIGCTPAGNQDQLLDNAVLNGDGSITATLAVAATAINTFRCTALRSNAKGTS